ncbi:MAG: TraB/GumN family protein [Tissierellia bacterium]|nr:TraB/GumN family protein [Tissierellia bacterium]
MDEKIVKIQYQDKKIYLIPAAHVSTESVELVKETIDEVDPDSVCIELDDARYENIQNENRWKNTNVIDIIRQKKVGLLIANLVLSSYQRNIAKKLKTKPGQEMVQGMISAKEKNANLVLADRDIQVTFLRIWRSISFVEKMKLLFSFLFSMDDDEEISEDDLDALMAKENLTTVISTMGDEFPQIAEILLHERDQYLANKIKNAPGEKIVAVLGAAHVPGISEEIFKDQDMKKITTIPKPSNVGKILPWLIPLTIIGIIIYGFVVNVQTGFAQLKTWLLWNSLFAAIFTIFALGHPLSILTAFIVAPFTSLNPFLACGWFAGLVEATVRKPTVEDVENIPEDIFSFKKILKNRFLKALVIVIFANIGSTIGTIIAGTNIIKMVFH